MKRMQIILYVMFIMSLIFLQSCGNQFNDSMIATAKTPTVWMYGMGPLGEIQMPSMLSCPYFDHIADGLEWHTLQIGVSTYREVIEELNPSEEWWNYSHAFLHLREGGDRSMHTWGIIQICFEGEILSALSVSAKYVDYLPSNLYGLISQLGDPDLITWGSTYWERCVIFFDEGLIAIVNLEFNDVEKFILFSPLSVEDFYESGILETLSRPSQELEPHYLQIPPENWELENPWLDVHPLNQSRQG